MERTAHIPTNRLEAFSDGVIAILITVMVFDLKLQEMPTDLTVWSQLKMVFPKFGSYALSFTVIAIMWVNHHQLFHQIKHTDGPLLWFSLHLLFWMSLVPFVTNFIGANPMLWQASFFYAMIFFMTAFSFSLLRNYVIRKELLHDTISKETHFRIRKKNRFALGIYLAAALISFVSVYMSFALFLLVPSMYFVPEKINHLDN
jgi:uncharacterized membrane protein